MGHHHKVLVCAVAAMALAADVAPEYEELARRRLRKMGVVFLEDDDAVNIQSRQRANQFCGATQIYAQVHRGNTQIQPLPPDLGLPGAAR